MLYRNKLHDIRMYFQSTDREKPNGPNLVDAIEPCFLAQGTHTWLKEIPQYRVSFKQRCHQFGFIVNNDNIVEMR